MNITRAHLDKNFVHKTAPLYQYDYGQVLKFEGVSLPDAYEVHFSNQDIQGTAKAQIGTADGVEIPDEYLLSGEPIYVWVFLHTGESDGETEYKTVIPVHKRAQKENAEPTPVQQDVITQTIAVLNTAVERAETAQDAWENMTAQAETLTPESEATASYAGGVLTLGIPEGKQGEQGDTGNGIASTILNPDYTLTINFTDGTSYTTASIRGAQGNDGNDGVGIASTVLNADYTLTITLTDGTSYTTPSIRGQKGEKGDRGNTPTITTQKSERTTTIYADGVAVGTVEDGHKGDKGDVGTPSLVNGVVVYMGFKKVVVSETNPVITAQEGYKYICGEVVSLRFTPSNVGVCGVMFTTGNTAPILTIPSSVELPEWFDPNNLDTNTAYEITVVDGTNGAVVIHDVVSDGITDVQVNGTSIVSDGVAEIPIASQQNFGAVKIGSGIGVSITSAGMLSLEMATTNQIKAGTERYKAIVPNNQSSSVFYGLAKASGDTTQSASNNAVGTYTDDAKIAIQKMLGIYQAPWELIREDTFTNDTEADHFVTVDSDGLPFELTDIIVLFETPTQNTDASKGKYGQIHIYKYGQSNSPYVQLECGQWTQTAGSAPKGCMAVVEQKDGLLFSQSVSSTSTSNRAAINYRYTQGFATASSGIFMPGFVVIFNKVGIPAVTGTGHYKIYGKRKWQ